MKSKIEEITLKANAESLEKTFSKMATELYNLVIEVEEIDLISTRTIILRSRDLKNLLYQFLKRLFDLANNDLFVLSSVKSLTIEQISEEYMLNSILIGDKMKPEYKVKDIIKQITDRNILIKEDLQGTHAQINLVIERRNVQEENKNEV
ncbi:archease [Candidatus Woesearchaeota archaeon]|nr:archease [Candidatus Woesearchaeota archaeon]